MVLLYLVSLSLLFMLEQYILPYLKWPESYICLGLISLDVD